MNSLKGDEKMSRYIIKTSSTGCLGRYGEYRRVAIVEVEPGVDEVSMISERARGVVRVVKTWEKLNVGTTSRCAYQVALSEARDQCARLNTGADD